MLLLYNIACKRKAHDAYVEEFCATPATTVKETFRWDKQNFPTEQQPKVRHIALLSV
jgi:hypothetical protein